ncbi:hypothetical protein FXO38_09813, partial [Capsicum annuum]
MMKLVEYKNGVTWIEEEAQKINVIEDLQFVVIGKFSYGCPELEDLRIQISKQCKVKGDCKISLLRNRHILMRVNLMRFHEHDVQKCVLYNGKGWSDITNETFHI